MIAALIIAAGKTARRDNFEPEREVGTIPAIQRIIRVFQRAGITRIVVVRDGQDIGPEKLASHMSAVFLRGNSDAEMFDHIKTGLAYLQDKSEGVLVTHADVPLFSVGTVHTLIAAGKPISTPSYQGQTGHPILLRMESFPAILSYDGEGGLAGAVRASGMESLVEVEDEGILANIHYDKNFDKLLAGHSLSELSPEVRFRVVREKAFYGPGAHQLLQLIAETSSLSEACRQMGISYSKGRSIVANMEQQLGRTVTEGSAGGKYGGFSTVTDTGKEMMRCYEAFCAEADESVHALFDKHFGSLNQAQGLKQRRSRKKGRKVTYPN